MARKVKRKCDVTKTEDMTPPSGERREKYKGSKGKKNFHFALINHLDNCTDPQNICKQTHRVLIAAFILYI